MRKQGMTQRAIARREELSKSQVDRILKMPRPLSAVQRRKKANRASRPGPKVTKRRKLVRKLLRARLPSGRKTFPSLSRVRSEVRRATKNTISRTTLFRDAKALGFKSRVRPLTCVRPEQWGARLEAAKRFLKIPCNQLLACDEKIFTTNDCTNRVEYCEPNEEPSRREAFRWGRGRCMVWVMIGVDTGHLIILPEENEDEEEGGNGRVLSFKLNAANYQELILEDEDVLADITDPNRMFLQDGAPCHRAKSVKDFLAENRVRVLDWPASSPDMNPAEKIWAYLASKASEKDPQNREQLEKAITKAWNAMPQAVINRFVRGWHGLCRAVIAKKGMM